MATSPLTAALKPNVSSGDEAERRYQEALNELTQRLDFRKNRLLDPTWLAMAQGFLTPGQTGSFAESLGNVAQRVGDVQRQQQKEDLDLAQIRLQVAQGAREQAARMRGQEAFRGILGGATTQGDSTVQAEGAASQAPGQAPAAGQAPAQGEIRPVSMTDALRFASAFPEQKELAKLLVDAAKFESDRFKISMNGTVFDTVTRKFVAQIPPGQTASDFFIPDAGGTVKMTPGQHADYQKARAEGKGKQWISSFFETEPGKPPEILTQEVLAQRAEERRQTPSLFLIPEADGEVSMTPGQYRQYLDARSKGQGQAWVNQFFSTSAAREPAVPRTQPTAAQPAAPSAAVVPPVAAPAVVEPQSRVFTPTPQQVLAENAALDARRRAEEEERQASIRQYGKPGIISPGAEDVSRRIEAERNIRVQPLAPRTPSVATSPVAAAQPAAQAATTAAQVPAQAAAQRAEPSTMLTRQELERRAAARNQIPQDYFIPEVGGNIKMTPLVYEQYARATDKKAWLDQFMKTPSGVMTSQQIETDAATRRAEAEAVARSDAERYSNAIAKADDAGSRINLTRRIAAIASQKDANKILGVFENGKFSDALLRLLESRDPKAGTVTGKDIRDIWTDIGLDPKLIADKQVLVSLIAQSLFDFRSLAKGQGAISNFEQQLFNQMGASMADRPEAVVRKMKMLERRAEFDREVSRMARNARRQGIAFDDMRDTEAYKTAYEKYTNDLMSQVTGAGRNLPQGAAPAGERPSATRPSERVFNGMVWERQPDGSYKNSGRRAQ